MSRVKRLAALEARRRAWEAERVPLAEVFGWLGAVLGAVQEEAGTPCLNRVAGRLIAAQAERVLSRQGRA